MRYFVLIEPFDAGIAPHIIAEVVREYSDNGLVRETSVAGILAGDRCQILTEDELLANHAGSLALSAWHELDDGQFDTDTARRNEEIERGDTRARRHLRLVPRSGREEPSDRDPSWSSPGIKR
jgi:hypothetical protein